MLIPVVAFFAFGAIVASFMGVVVARLATGQSFFTGRSRCDACGAPVAPLALVPIVSFFSSGGRARCCDARLSFSAPLSELALGSLFVLAYLRLGVSLALPFVLLAFALLLALVLYDLAHQILPSRLVYPFVVVSALAGFFSASSLGAFVASVDTALLVGTSLALIHFFSLGRAMGLADAPLAFGLALLAGPALLALSGFIYAFWIGAVIGIIVLARRPRGSRMRVEVPFAPFLAAGFLLAYATQWNLFTILAVLS